MNRPVRGAAALPSWDDAAAPGGELDRHLLRLAQSIVHDRHLAEDVVQEALVRAWQRIATLRDPVAFPAWISTITRRLAITRLRKRSRDAARSIEVSEDEVPPVNHVHAWSEREIEALIETLTPTLRRTVELFCTGASLKEIAVAEETSYGCVKTRLCRARREIRRIAIARSVTSRLGPTSRSGPFFGAVDARWIGRHGSVRRDHCDRKRARSARVRSRIHHERRWPQSSEKPLILVRPIHNAHPFSYTHRSPVDPRQDQLARARTRSRLRHAPERSSASPLRGGADGYRQDHSSRESHLAGHPRWQGTGVPRSARRLGCRHRESSP